jgi:hypothetical protein
MRLNSSFTNNYNSVVVREEFIIIHVLLGRGSWIECLPLLVLPFLFAARSFHDNIFRLLRNSLGHHHDGLLWNEWSQSLGSLGGLQDALELGIIGEVTGMEVGVGTSLRLLALFGLRDDWDGFIVFEDARVVFLDFLLGLSISGNEFLLISLLLDDGDAALCLFLVC